MKTPATADLLDEDGTLAVCDLQFRSFGKRRRFSGRIVTIQTRHDVGLFKDLVGTPGEGRVIVVDGDGSLAYALCGDRLAALAAENGWAGIVIYGAIRDSAEIDTLEIGVKALGTNPRRPTFNAIGEQDVPIAFGGIAFHPGEWLYSDEDGIVVSEKPLA